MEYPVVNGTDFNAFNSPEESIYYSHCLRYLVFDRLKETANIIEFGSGDGSPVVTALQASNFHGSITGFEINPTASERAIKLISVSSLKGHYTVNTGSFFELAEFCADDILISDPPFLPAKSNSIKDPFLWGGNDGSDIYIKLLECGYIKLMLMIASYANPRKILTHAIKQGYSVQDFLVAPMTIGEYSREMPVWNRLQEMKVVQEAFYSSSHFLLAGVVFDKKSSRPSLAGELINTLTSIH